MIDLKDVSFKYHDGGGVEKLTMHIKKGECVVLTGASGCGKTTVTRLINGLSPYFYPGEFYGEICVAGAVNEQLNPDRISAKVGSVFQNPRSQFFSLDTTSEIAFTCENLGFNRDETLRRLQQSAKILGIEHLLDKDIFKLSGGEKQMVAIASVLAPDPPIFVLDEPSANLDAQATRELACILKKLKSLGKTIVIAEHRLYYLMDVADRFIHIEKGKIAHEWTNRTFAALPDAQRKTFGLRAVTLETLRPQIPEATAMKENVLSVSDCSFYYQKNTPVLANLNISVSPGEVIGLIGKNGEGKSTLARILCGLQKEKRGTVALCGKPLRPKQRTKAAYLVMQEPGYQLFTESIEAEMRLTDAAPGPERIDEMLHTLNLDTFKDRHPMSLSGGQKQRLSIGVSMMKHADVFIMDEPTSGLDYENMMRIKELIIKLREQGKKVLIITHDYEFLLYTCTRVLHMADGKIYRDYVLNNKNIHLLREFFIPEKEEIFYEHRRKINS